MHAAVMQFALRDDLRIARITVEGSEHDLQSITTQSRSRSSTASRAEAASRRTSLSMDSWRKAVLNAPTRCASSLRTKPVNDITGFMFSLDSLTFRFLKPDLVAATRSSCATKPA